MEFISHGRLLGVFCFVCWASVSVTTAATTSSPTTAFSTPSLRPNTTGQALWPDYAKYSNAVAGNFVHLTAIPFTYYECITNLVEINYYGYMVLGSQYERRDPPAPAEWPSLPKLMGVYWSRFSSLGYNNEPSLYIDYSYHRLVNVTYENSLIRYIKKVISEPEFEPLVIFAATWENMKPKGYENDSATFQAFLVTDTSVTYAVRVYDSLWQSPELANETYYAAAYSQGYGDKPKISTPDTHSGPEVILLGTKKPNKDPYTCVEKTQTVYANLSSSLNVLPPCPCYEVQAANDQQFTSSNVSTRCYQSKTLPAGGSLLQLCCYNQYGHLINYTREARVPVSADPTDLRLQEAHEKCCADGSGLCVWFYNNVYLTKCANYTPAINRSELPIIYASNNEIVYKPSGGIFSNSWSVENRTGVTYNMSTTFNSSHGVLLNGPGYIWNFKNALNELRKVSYPQRLVFYATNANNLSTSYAPTIKLCLCQLDEQCYVNTNSMDSYEKGNVISMVCDCKGNGTGRFCEKPINVCDNCLVNTTSGCDSNPKNYCPTCPLGYQRNGTQCIVKKTPTIPTTTPRDGGNKHDSTYLLIILSFITSYTLWMQNLLTTRM